MANERRRFSAGDRKTAASRSRLVRIARKATEINPIHVGTFIAIEAGSSCVHDGRAFRKSLHTTPLRVVDTMPGGSGSDAAAKSVNVLCGSARTPNTSEPATTATERPATMRLAGHNANVIATHPRIYVGRPYLRLNTVGENNMPTNPMVRRSLLILVSAERTRTKSAGSARHIS